MGPIRKTPSYPGTRQEVSPAAPGAPAPGVGGCSPPTLAGDTRWACRASAASWAAIASLLAACATPAPPPPPARAPAPAPVQAPSPEPIAVPPPPAQVEGPAPGSPAALQAAQRLALAAAELLEQGQEDQGLAEVQKALVLDPHQRIASSLLKQIQTDPTTLLGRESFTYRVQPGESLSRIAQRFLGDVHMFYALARFNDLKVPRQLQGGQTIRVPGKAPPAGAAALVAPAAAPAALPPSIKPAAAAASQAEEGRNAERDRQARISTATRAARSAFARQDLNTAIKHWDAVLELDPANQTAQLERKKAIDLRDKLGKVR